MNPFNVSRPVCIIGLGLIGGSLLRDLAGLKHPVFGYNRSTSGTRRAVKQGYDVSNDLPEVLQRAEREQALIVIAVPFSAVFEVLDEVAAHAPSCGITDVVSVKAPVYKAVLAHGMESRYVGGHPMAGTAHSGWDASHTGLFRGAAWAVTYDYAAESERVERCWTELFTDVVKLISMVKAEAMPVRVKKHDEAVARVSHLPHVIAEALAVTGDRGGILSQSLAAGSFKDATRVAGTRPELVRQMCETNSAAVVKAIDEFMGVLEHARDNLAAPEPSIAKLADAGFAARTRLEARTGARRESVSPVKISSRPVLRLSLGGHGWVDQLRQAESMGGRIEVF
ncbi:prephenate dehydrogenase [Corynebacterium phocae]|uniref:Prephenate dehydrogenase n=1 Tax=Corynebacterium phocae TaxID=161895 RepID=A0A1L7D0M9_9CORY|nr:prephenate dehydrogenase [Corynebacterium phocae]APT91705.1 prephenate dehydrogenase [Corynebacterium phocae]KAA8728611.1 prephenate dehydrogenase [Corynebacterium phocae]